MTTEIEGVIYFSSGEIAEEVGVSRQTLWRWRREGKVPVGRRFRDGQVLFTAEEADEIRQHAVRMDPIDDGEKDQMKLFNGAGRGAQ